ncbi:MAG: C40 family peptidase [Saprospiraceae bacterium]|nr:C40 family peptidase [Saprospiraceae bacterium]
MHKTVAKVRAVLTWTLVFMSIMAPFYYSGCSTSTRGVVYEDTDFRQNMQRNQVVAYARELVGTKYKYGGRDTRGFDCSGFTRYVLKYFEVELSPSSRAQSKQGKAVEVDETRAGDLIFFRRPSGGAIFHVAMVVSNDHYGLKVIHSTSRGVVIDDISRSTYWKPKIFSARDVLSR